MWRSLLGFGDGGEGLALVLRGALDGRHEVGDEVGASLVDVLDLRPLAVDGLIEVTRRL